MDTIAFIVWVIILAFLFGAGWWQLLLYAIYFGLLMVVGAKKKY